jgi:hypothetical protein
MSIRGNRDEHNRRSNRFLGRIYQSHGKEHASSDLAAAPDHAEPRALCLAGGESVSS